MKSINQFSTDIIPLDARYYDSNKHCFTEWYPEPHYQLDYESICVFAACGFFLGDTTFFRELKTLAPATRYTIKGHKLHKEPTWSWTYEPDDLTLERATDLFESIIDSLVARAIAKKRIILPLSGGLDSRSLAAAIPEDRRHDVCSYSYAFEKGVDEPFYGKRIAEVKGFSFERFNIPRESLWRHIDTLADLNHCFSEFTHPRQIAIKHWLDSICNRNSILLLGHWGDVLFDGADVPDSLPEEEIAGYLKKGILKKGGSELGRALWRHWGLEGDFDRYLHARIRTLAGEINIKNARSKIRAFKSIHWAPRWTSTNLSVFSDAGPVFLPYYQREICELITRIPEEILSGRKIQIEYIKRKSTALAKIPWQAFSPCHLYNYGDFSSFKNLPGRVIRKLSRITSEKVFGRKLIQRNWENQFHGAFNEAQLKQYLYHGALTQHVDKQLIQKFYRAFQFEDSVHYAHVISMLLTLAVFFERQQ
ncbi:MAG: asparagine synthase [Acidobacteria bacterium]|nr:MAG: asparagine synthase [Acidobacteriota bacterium]